MGSSKSKLVWIITGLLVLGWLSACGSPQKATSNPKFQVDVTFTDFYRQIGGSEVLGPALSAAFTDSGLTYQYVVSGLMVYDPNQVALKRFHFSALASTQWNIHSLVEPTPTVTDLDYANGHQVWEEAAEFYRQYGADIIGVPVTSVRANDAKQRYEQYFEGLGFYRNYTDPPGDTHLMPYGVWMCGMDCRYATPDADPPAGSYVRQNTATEQLFLQTSEQLGYGYTGEPLAGPRLGADGNYEMAFENVILFIDPAAGNQIRLRPLPQWLGIQKEKLLEETKADWLAFYPIQNGLGFNVPKTFATYIAEHGGVIYTGVPIAEYMKLADGGYSQCYTTMCIEYHPTAPLALRTRLHPLGAEYLSLDGNVNATGSSPTEALQIDAWEDYPLIASGQSQGINIQATQNKATASGLKFSLVVTQPNGITKTYSLPPTGEDGKTHIDLDPINGPNGAIVQYEVCLLEESAPQICFSRSYTIWEQ